MSEFNVLWLLRFRLFSFVQSQEHINHIFLSSPRGDGLPPTTSFTTLKGDQDQDLNLFYGKYIAMLQRDLYSG